MAVQQSLFAHQSIGSKLFAQAWEVYPDREGPHSKRDALLQWNRRVTEGVSEEDMLAGARRFRRYMDATGQSKTRFVMQAKRFFGPARYFEAEYKTTAEMATPRRWRPLTVDEPRAPTGTLTSMLRKAMRKK